TTFTSPMVGLNGADGGTISPDGTSLVFVATDALGKAQLWVRRLDAFSAQPLAGTDDAVFPFWSPDSRFLGFFAQGKLKTVAVAGGCPRPFVRCRRLQRWAAPGAATGSSCLADCRPKSSELPPTEGSPRP